MARSFKDITKEEWLACNYPGEMMVWLRTASSRKLRLFACATCRQIWDKISPGGREVILAAERFADGEISRNEMNTVREHHAASLPRDRANSAARATAASRKNALADVIGDVATSHDEGLETAHLHHVVLLRDIFDYLFLEATVENWRSASVLAVARTIYNDKAYDQMPILADALQDAGCDNDDILSHCRNSKVHVRGCWVVDLILGKE